MKASGGWGGRHLNQAAPAAPAGALAAAPARVQSGGVIDALPPLLAARLADAMVVLHAGVVLFAVGGLLAIVVGGLRRSRWVRAPLWRTLHLALVVFIALQAWLGRLCPLTVLELALRRRAGEAGVEQAFVAYWLERLLYVQAPWWAFVLAYSLFAGAVLACWMWQPPRRRLGDTLAR